MGRGDSGLRTPRGTAAPPSDIQDFAEADFEQIDQNHVAQACAALQANDEPTSWDQDITERKNSRTAAFAVAEAANKDEFISILSPRTRTLLNAMLDGRAATPRRQQDKATSNRGLQTIERTAG